MKETKIKNSVFRDQNKEEKVKYFRVLISWILCWNNNTVNNRNKNIFVEKWGTFFCVCVCVCVNIAFNHFMDLIFGYPNIFLTVRFVILIFPSYFKKNKLQFSENLTVLMTLILWFIVFITTLLFRHITYSSSKKFFLMFLDCSCLLSSM